MDKQGWKNFQEMIDEGQEISFNFKGEEWWISRLYDEEKSYLLTAPDTYTQFFKTADELYKNGMMDGKPFIERVPEIDW